MAGGSTGAGTTAVAAMQAANTNSGINTEPMANLGTATGAVEQQQLTHQPTS